MQPLLLSLSRGPHIALGLADLATALDAHTVATELLPNLVAVLVTPPASLAQLSPAKGNGSPQGQSPKVVLGMLCLASDRGQAHAVGAPFEGRFEEPPQALW